MAKLKVLDEIAKLWDAVKDISLSWGNITDKPTEFPPSPHTHSEYTKTYKSLEEIDPTFTTNTPIKSVILAMEVDSMAIYDISISDDAVYPTVDGTVIITKQNSARNYVQCSSTEEGVWYTNYHSAYNPNCEWKQLATTAKTEILCTENTGYTIIEQKCYETGMRFVFTVHIEKEDKSVFATNTNIPVCKSVYGSETLICPINTMGIIGGELKGVCNGFIRNNGEIEICLMTDNVVSVWIQGEVIL